VRLFEALHGLALRALPASSRRRDGPELRRLFGEVVDDVRRRRGPAAARTRALRELSDLLAVGAGLRWRRLAAPGGESVAAHRRGFAVPPSTP